MPKGKYFNANEEDGCSLLAMAPFSSVLPLRMNELFKNKVDIVAEIRQGHFKWCAPIGKYKLMGIEVLNKILKSPSYIPSLKKSILHSSNHLMQFAKNLYRQKPSSFSNKDLAKVFEDHYELVLDMLEFGFATSMMELSNDILSNHLRKIIANKIARYGKNHSAAEYFQSLTEETRPTPANQEKEERLALALAIEKLKGKPLTKAVEKKIHQHAEEYFWIDFGYQGPLRSVAYFKKEITSLARRHVANEELKQIKQRKKAILPNLKTAEKELHLTATEKRLFSDARDCIFIKNYRKEALIYSLAVLENYIKEAARRSKVAVQNVRCCLPTEILDLLKGKISSKELSLRDKMVFYYVKNNKIVVETGEAAHKHFHQYVQEEEAGTDSVLRGSTGCSGHAKGVVKVINIAKDMKKMKPGDILVSIATIPELVPAMQKAGAIITDIGGITSHAAIVSRELRKPCVIGTRFATKTLKDGDLVEVDASHGWIKKL